MNHFKESNVCVSDGIVVRFSGRKKEASFKLDILNDGDQYIEIERIQVDLDTIIPRFDDINGIGIRPFRELSLIFDVLRLSDLADTISRIRIFFNDFAVTRWVKIIYNECAFIRKQARAIQRQKYPIPKELFDIMDSIQTYKERMDALDALDALIPATDDLNFSNYSDYFHGLLYLEQIGMERRFRIYNRQKSFLRQNKQHKFEIFLDDVFESRPSLSVGDWVFARKNKKPHTEYEGTVVGLEENIVTIEFDHDFKKTFENGSYEIEFIPNPVAFFHGHRTIDLACEMFDSEFLFPDRMKQTKNLQLDVILNERYDLQLCETGELLPWFNNKLNKFQRVAVLNVLRSDCPTMPHIIYGPPGTGKTTTLIEIILQLNRNIEKRRILIAVQSNSNANLLAQLLIDSGDLCPSELLRITSFTYAKGNKMPIGLIAYSAMISLNGLPQYDDEGNDNSLKIRKINGVKQLDQFRLIIGTNASMSAFVECSQIDFSFTHAIIDEAGQCTEVDALIPMLMVGKEGQIIMAGDPKQMPPVAFDIYARDRGLTKSLFCRMLERYARLSNNNCYFNNKLVTKLMYNYRSLPCILDFVNKQFYNSELIPMVSSTHSREARTLKFVMEEGVVLENDNKHGVYFFNVNGTNAKMGTTSWCNAAEALEIENMVKAIIDTGISAEDIGVISPYYLQVKNIKHNLCERMGINVSVGTVDEFQGQERLIVLLSTVRTCEENVKLDAKRLLGFVQCPKRLNVAASRARALFVVFGKADLLKIDENWEVLINQCHLNGTFVDNNHRMQK